MIKLEQLISFEAIIREARINNSTELDLSHCALQTIPRDVFTLKQLKVLKLIGNRIESIPKELGQLSNLTHLYLYQNRINDIEEEVIDSIKYLECLDLAENPICYNELKLKTVFERMDKWKGYKECLWSIEKEKEGIKLNQEKAYKYIDTFKNPDCPPYFFYCSTLKVFPKEIFELTSIEYLAFHGGEVAEIPEGIGRLSNLKHLDLTGNKIQKLPADIIELQNLEKIILIDNNFEEFPDELLKLPKLKELNISKNQLKTFNREIFNKPTIELFYAFANPLIDFDEREFNYDYKELKTRFAK